MKKIVALIIGMCLSSFVFANKTSTPKPLQVPFVNQSINSSEYEGLSVSYNMNTTPVQKVVCTLANFYKGWMEYTENNAAKETSTYGGAQTVIFTSKGQTQYISENLDQFTPLFGRSSSADQIEIKLPAPVFSSNTSIEEALKKRRSIRTYKKLPITLKEIAQLLWAAQGITSANGFRTVPSAGALYPLEIFLVVGNGNPLSSGIYHYLPTKHSLKKIKDGDFRNQLFSAANGQEAVKLGAIDILITAVFYRTTQKYGENGKRFVYMEAGHAAQNIYLQAVSLNLGTVSIGAFDNKQIKTILNLKEEDPLYIMPIGKI